MVAGKKYMYLRNDEEMMCGKQGQGGICIFKTGQACIMGTYNQDMSPANNTKEVGKMAVRKQPSARLVQSASCQLAAPLSGRHTVAPLTPEGRGYMRADS